MQFYDNPWVKPLAKLPITLSPLTALQKKHFGHVLNPVRWWGRLPFLFWLVALFVGFLERKKSALPPSLRALVMTRVSQVCECAFCVDANSLRLAQRSGSMEKVMAVAAWQDSSLFDDAECAALAYAEGMSATPPQLNDDVKEQLKRHYSEQAITELTALVAFQNLSARFNAALDIPSQGLCSGQDKDHV